MPRKHAMVQYRAGKGQRIETAGRASALPETRKT